jgi:hypothetical protein
MFPEVPRFKGFFESLSQGKHPFEDKKLDLEEKTKEDR